MGTRITVKAALAAAMLAACACTVHQADSGPAPFGPSDFALTLGLSVTPDSISQDGASQASVVVTAQDAAGAPKSGVVVRLDMQVGGVTQDFGLLSARTIVTGSDGRASAIYTAPVSSPTAGGSGTRVTIVATASGSNAQAPTSRSAEIRLVPPGVILPPAGTPTAAFSVSPTPAFVGVTVNFDAAASTPGAGATQISSYTWSFGDGTTGSGRNATHTFQSAQTFNVTLTVTNDRSLSASTSTPVAVGLQPSAQPTATFTFSPASPGVNETVFFNASTSTAGSGSITSYNWTFGDGSTATGVSPSHAYATAGSYGVQLKVTNDSGSSNTSPATTVTVGAPPSPTANFTFSPSQPVVGQQVVFDSSSSTTAQGQTIVDVAWNFGDGTAVIHCPGGSAADCPGPTNRISAHTFNSAQTFVVNLVVTDSAGRTGSRSQTITIADPNPVAVLNLFKAGGNNITADGSGSAAKGSQTIVSYRFVWGDGSPDTVGASSSASHPYAAPGAHTVTLIVTDSSGPPGRTGSTQKDITTP